MKRLVALLFGLALFSLPCAAAGQGTLHMTDVPSPSLEKALLAPASMKETAIYLPPSYDGSSRRYPVVYFLPGYNTAISNFAGGGKKGSFDLKPAMDRLIAQGKVREMIVVIASGVTPLGGSFYVNSAINGNWEDFIVKDLVSYVDSHYRTLASRQSRGIAGQSMGGFGALNIAMRHPDVFGALYAMSPGVAAPDGMKTHPAFDPAVRAAVIAIQGKIAGLEPAAARADLVAHTGKLDPPVGAARFAIAYGLVFAPETGGKLFEYPFPSGDPAGDARVWKRYDTGFGGWDGKVRVNLANLKKLSSITIDVGDHDHYGFIREGCRYFSKLLTANGVKHKYDVYSGDHSDKVGERLENQVLPSMSAVLRAER